MTLARRIIEFIVRRVVGLEIPNLLGLLEELDRNPDRYSIAVYRGDGELTVVLYRDNVKILSAAIKGYEARVKKDVDALASHVLTSARVKILVGDEND